MNKKFSTLVATLLVSGGLVYAMDAMAMTANGGVAQTYVMANAELSSGSVTGYTLAVGTDNTNTWALVSNGNGGFYLSPASGWYLAVDGMVKKVEGNTPDVATIAAGNVVKVGSKTLKLVNGNLEMNATGGESLSLFNDGSVVNAVSTATESLVLATSKEVNEDLVISSQKVATANFSFDVAMGSVVAGSGFSAADKQKFTVVSDGSTGFVLSIEINKTMYYLRAESAGDPVTYVTDLSQASALTVSSGTPSLGGAVLKVNNGVIVAGSDGGDALLMAQSGDYEGNRPGAGDEVYLATGTNSTFASDNLIPIKTVAKVASLAASAQLDALSADEKSSFTWTEATNGGKISLGNQYLKVDGNSLVFALDDTQAATFTYDGVLKTSGNIVTVTDDGLSIAAGAVGDKATLHVVDGGSITATQASVVVDGTYVIAGLKTTAAADKCLVANAQQAVEPGAPGEEFGAIEGVTIQKDGILEVTTSDVKDIPAPIYVTIGTDANKYLTVDAEGKVLLTDKPSSSWVLVDGKMKNLDLEKKGETKIWLSGSLMARSTATGFALVENSTNGVAVSFSPSTITIGSSELASTLTLSGQSLVAPANQSNPLLAAVDDNYVYVGDGTNYFTAAADGTTTTNINSAELWSVKTSTMVDGRSYFSFVSRTDASKLSIDGATKFAGKYANGVQLIAIDNKTGNVVINGISSSTSLENGTAATPIGFYRSNLEQFDAKYLLHRRGSSFNLELMDKKDGEKNLKGNVFAGADLVPMEVEWNGGKVKSLKPATDTDDKTFLLKKGDNYIVLDLDTKWGNITGQVVDGGYQFTVLNETNLIKVLEGSEVNNHSYNAYFRINYLQGSTEVGDKITESTPIYSIQVGNEDLSTAYNLVTFEINSGDQKGVYLTVDKTETNKVFATFKAQNVVHGSQKDNNPLNMKYVNIEFANHSSVTYEAENGNKVSLNGKVLGVKTNATSVVPVEKGNFLFAKPEGQWAVSMTKAIGNLKTGVTLNSDNDTQFTFTNRESGAEYAVEKMHYMGDNMYAVEYAAEEVPIGQATGYAGRDTLIITPAATLKNDAVQMDGYAAWKAADVQDELFRLIVASGQKSFYVTENHSKDSHFLGLNEEVEVATNWRIVPLTETRKWDSDKVLKTATDSVYIINAPQKYADGKYYAHQDTLAIVSYALQNINNGEYLTYEPKQTTTILSMISDPDSKNYTTSKDLSNAYRFILKEKTDGLYNIVGTTGAAVDTKGYVVDAANANATINLSRKLYGATTYTKGGAVEVEKAYAQINSNDLFKIEKVTAPRYRKMAQGDTIRIFRDENNYSTLFENGEFLNLGSTAEIKGMKPALYVDTAYVERGTNNRYQYLLAVNVERVAPAYCDIPNHPALHPDTTYGRFLVNLVDSAVYTYNKGVTHNNKYINDKEADRTEVKTGFVWGYRTADKLYLTEGQNFSKVKDVIDLSAADFNIAKFAFRYVTPESNDVNGAFKIQTRYVDYSSAISTAKKENWASNNNGYLKTINGVIVVTDSYANAEEFNLAAEKSAPTSNDQIGTSEVSIIAGVGSVAVKNAAGKTVSISNILGQTIVNTILTSDNASISVPSGIVVVAVEGEEAVKTVVR